MKRLAITSFSASMRSRAPMVMLFTILSLHILVACSAAEPTDHTIELTIIEGNLSGNSPITVKQRDSVHFHVTSDSNGVLHLHGYEMEISVNPNETTMFDLMAESTGRFKLTFHAEELEDDTHNHGHEELSAVMFIVLPR